MRTGDSEGGSCVPTIFQDCVRGILRRPAASPSLSRGLVRSPSLGGGRGKRVRKYQGRFEAGKTQEVSAVPLSYQFGADYWGKRCKVSGRLEIFYIWESWIRCYPVASWYRQHRSQAVVGVMPRVRVSSRDNRTPVPRRLPETRDVNRGNTRPHSRQGGQFSSMGIERCRASSGSRGRFRESARGGA